MNNKPDTIPDVEGELQKAFSQKSDKELRSIVNEEDIYGKKFLDAAREELTGRVMGTRQQKTAEDIRFEEEQERLAEEERLRQEEEERVLRMAEQAAEAERIAAVNRRLMGRIAFIVPCVLAITLLIMFFFWNNTFPRLLERGRTALEQGDRAKAEELFQRAVKKETDGEASYELYKLTDNDFRLKQAADCGHSTAALLYGTQLLKREMWRLATEYLEKASDYNSERNYMLGCAYFVLQRSTQAKNAWERASVQGHLMANARLGDWYLCYGKVEDFEKALEYYLNAPKVCPGIAEKIKVLKDLQKQASRSGWGEGFSSDSWDGYEQRFYGESSYWGDKSVLRGIYWRKDGSCRYYGKFSSNKRLLNGLGIATYSNGNVYVGNLKVVSDKGNTYHVYYSGQGTLTHSNGTIKIGQWKNDRLIGKYTETDLFGQTIK